MLAITCTSFWEFKSPGEPGHRGPHNFVRFTSQGWTNFSQILRKTFPCTSSMRRENEPFSNMPEHCVLNKAWPHVKLVTQEPNLIILYYQNLNDLGKGNTQLQLTQVILSQLRGREQSEKPVKFTVQGQLTKDWGLITGQKNASPPTTPPHHIPKGLFIAVHVTWYVRLSY